MANGGEGVALRWAEAFCSISWRRCRSCNVVAPRCWAGILVVRACARLAAAAMMASAGVTVGVVMYLCLKNTDAEFRVVRVLVIHTVQHL